MRAPLMASGGAMSGDHRCVTRLSVPVSVEARHMAAAVRFPISTVPAAIYEGVVL